MWEGIQATIVGMGRSAAGAAALLKSRGAVPFVTEAADGEAVAPWRAELDSLGVSYETGGHTFRAWDHSELVVLSPGVPLALQPIQSLLKRGVPVIGELELASRFTQAPVLAVTGTNGKTTVTEMIRHVLRDLGYNAILAGNNHTAFSQAVLRDPAPDFFVLEVSSYQLETIKRFRPSVGAVLNLTADHLGRHGTLEGYAVAKERLFANQQPESDAAVLNADDPLTRGMLTPPGVPRISFSLDHANGSGLCWDGERLWVDGAPHVFQPPLPGRHNIANALAALAVLHGAKIDIAGAIRALESFQGVEHRLEPAGVYQGVTYFNDSKSTNIDSLRVALESFDSPVTLIAGGQGKGSSYAPLMPLVRGRVGRCIALGEEGPALAEAFGAAVPVEVVPDMEKAVTAAAAQTPPGGIVVLSPGCASFDQYRNFEERGAHFKALVAGLNHEECLS